MVSLDTKQIIESWISPMAMLKNKKIGTTIAFVALFLVAATTALILCRLPYFESGVTP